jgi:hypothetical protein
VLAELYASRTRLTDAGTALLDAAPKLIGLGLGETAVGDATLARIAKLSRLRTLVLSKVRASRSALDRLGALTALERLYIEETTADDATIAGLARLRDLRVLHVAGTELSDRALATLHRFARLEELTIGHTMIGAAVADLDAWPRMHVLSLTALELDDEAVARIAQRRSLSTLDLSATEVSDPTPLAALPDLRALGLAHTRLTSSGEATVRALTARGVEVAR